MREQTILDGNAVSDDSRTNVYHVVTCVPDATQVGDLPTRFAEGESISSTSLSAWPLLGLNPTQGELLNNIEQECRESRDKRTIVLDGLTIMGGYANEIDEDDEEDTFQKLTYFRGGGILVEGNWNNAEATEIDLPEVLGVAKRNIPLLMTSCLLKDNTAANGGGVYTNGTFYSFSCHFTKNLATGPMTTADQTYIPWSAGGAIAGNYEIHLWNSLFDNNEARRGNYPITNTTITNADARQGYGGAVSCSETGLARICNSDFVRNKAVAYPALYNFLDNNLRSASSMVPEANRLTSPSYYGVGWHFAVNTIFWGNNATADELAEATEIVQEYYDDLYGAGNWTDLRKPYHVANFAPKLDVATLTFCSLEQGTGREGTVWYSNHDRAKEAAIVPKDYGDGHGLIDGLTRLYQGRFTDVLDDYFGYYPDGSSSTPFYKLDGSGNPIPCAMDDEDILLEGAVPTTEQKNSAVAYNYNLVLEKDNQVPGGPYFVQPSLSAGVDGYMETADWLVARLNNSVDTGWGYLKQSVEQEDESSSLFNTTFLDNSLEKATPATDQYDDLYGEGFYNLHSKNIHSRFEDIGYPNLLPIGDEPYMEYSRDGAGDGENMRRISTHPKMGVQDVFIDMGIYEYQYVQLVTAGDEIDVIWVSPTQNEGVVCDGSTAYKATSDLQLAIETLLLSRNDHDKVIKFKTGTYSPNKVTQNNMKAFYVNVPTKQDGVMLPKTLAGDETHTARSLTFKGGYPNDLMDFPLKDYEDQRDIVANPVTLLMTKEIGNEAHQLEHLFIVEDSELKGTFANYMQGKNPDFIESTMPIVFDGLTFCNPYGSNHTVGGSALYYGAQYQTKLNEGTQTYYKDHDHLLKPQSFVLDEVEHNMPKLIIKECAFVASGIEDGVSAVKIEKGGGHSLIVNSLFHSNSGAPLDAVNTMVINCTFALNGGHVTLKDDPEVYYDDPTPYHYPPALHNCIIWKDDENQTDPSLKKQWDDTDLNLSDGSMRYNAYTYWNTGTEAFDEPIGTTEEDAQHNMLLSTDNEDVLLGPNFINPTGVDPGVGTAEERLLAQKLSRDFRLNPSAHILNKASETVYKNFVPYYAETSTTEEKTKDEITYYFHSIQHSTPVVLTDAQLKGTNADKDYDGYTEFELYNVPRWNGVAIDRGAYECTAILQRVLYVMDGPVGRKDGTTWEHAYAIDHLQRAIDVASIYSLTSSNTPAERERAYVFVRAADYTGEALKLRDGVSVYGGVTDIMSSVEKEGDVFTDENIAKYINKVKAERNGTAAEDAPHNTVRGLVSPNNSVHASGFLLDGFWIQGSSDPIDMSKDNTVLVNDVITGNTVAESGQPVVNLAGGSTTGSLLYNSLVYGNTAGSGAPVVSVGAKGYVLNCTVVAPYNTAISGTMANVGNTIARDNTETGPMFAPYLGYTNAYNASLPASLKDWKPYWYQLHEFSNQINTGTDDNGAGVGSTVRDGGNSIAKLFSDYVDFSHDRDVLGNPRRLRGRVDNGCFETWRIEENAKVKATNVTNATFTTNYGGHQYPHAGSVVYLLKNASLIFAVDGEQNPLFTTAISPGYVLLKEGASIYGQGNRLSFPYVAAEKFIGARYSLMAFPFDVNVEGTVEVTGTATLTQTDKSGDITPYVYDAARRSAYNYEFQEDNSSLWKTDLTPVLNAASQISRTEGWLLDFGDNTPSDTLRFTGWNAAPAVVYAEDGSATKSVTLTQHDAHVTTATGYPRFTKAEDMGWNLKGLPWLVSNYRTGGTNPDFKMNVPHVFYSMQGNGKYAKMPGCLWSAQSWDPGASLSVGNGFFTQTAVIESTEDLTFKIPLFSGDTEAPSRERLSIDFEDEDGRGDCVTIVGYDEAGMMPYRINSDAIKWMPFQKSAPQMWITNSDGTPFSLLSHAPIETPLPVGLIVPGEMRYSFSLRDKSAVPEGISAVWLIDKQAGRVVNLMEKAYTPNHLAPQTSDHKTRFYIQLGGRPQLDMLPSAHTLRVYVHDRILHIEGTNEGDPIAVYTTTGALQVTGQAAGSHWQTPVQRGVFIVRVQGETYKVAAK